MLYLIQKDETTGLYYVYSNDEHDVLSNLTPDGFATHEEAESWMDVQTKGPLRPFRYYEE